MNSNSSSFFLGVGESLLGNENTIKEFSLVLISNTAYLVDSRAGKGDTGNINSVENKLILNVLGGVHGGVWGEDDEMGFLSTKEVLDFN
jgi:hypothetical protein